MRTDDEASKRIFEASLRSFIKVRQMTQSHLVPENTYTSLFSLTRIHFINTVVLMVTVRQVDTNV
jgi:hypothetical protein